MGREDASPVPLIFLFAKLATMTPIVRSVSITVMDFTSPTSPVSHVTYFSMDASSVTLLIVLNVFLIS